MNHSHDFYDRDDDLAHCKVCGGAEGSLPTLCPGVRMTHAQETAVYDRTLDFNCGNFGSDRHTAGWWAPLLPFEETSERAAFEDACYAHYLKRRGEAATNGRSIVLDDQECLMIGRKPQVTCEQIVEALTSIGAMSAKELQTHFNVPSDKAVMARLRTLRDDKRVYIGERRAVLGRRGKQTPVYALMVTGSEVDAAEGRSSDSQRNKRYRERNAMAISARRYGKRGAAGGGELGLWGGLVKKA